MSNKHFYKTICFVFLLCVVNTSYSQSAIDSLEKLVRTSKGIEKAEHIYKLNDLLRDAGLTEKTLVYGQEALKIAIESKSLVNQSRSYLEIGIYYQSKLAWEQALKNYLEAYRISETLKSKSYIGIVINNIANVYREMRNLDKAKEYFIEGAKISYELGNKEQIAISECGLGAIYYDTNELEKALEAFNKGLYYFKSIDDKVQVAVMENNIGSVNNDLGKYADAIENYKTALAIFSDMRDSISISMCLGNIGNVYNMSNKPKEGIEYSKKALAIAERLDAKQIVANTYVFIIEGSQKLNDYKMMSEYQAKLLSLKDTIYDFQTNENIADMQTRYDSDKKEKENKILKQQNDLQSLSINQQKIINYAVICGLILLSVLAFFIFKSYRQKQKANLQLEEKNNLIEEKNKIVEEKQKEIIDSINYAKRIQYSLLAHETLLKENLEKHFVYFKPKDIVSGDFYWATKNGNKFYFAVCDSTGHGVPGAFMSLLSIGFLSEAIKEKHIEAPNEVFNYVRERLIETVSKEGQKDGFDGVLICMDLDTKRITYAAANNKPILINNGTLKELPTDRMPVGLGERQEDFKLHTIDAQPGDMLYLYTDGFADQFGGTKGKKFKYKPLNELLLAQHNQAMTQQKENLESTFENWRGNLEQVDDVCIIGIHI